MSEGARITPYRDGPLLVRGPFSITDQDGNEIEVHQRTVALCRCGRSRQKPFCDGMHKAISFRAESGLQQADPPQPSAPVAECGEPTGLDSGEPRWRR